MVMAAGLIAGAVAQDAKPKDVAKLLKDQLVAVDGDTVKAAKLEEGMDYYLVYHSASW